MKICFLAPANSAHTIKWCNYFVSQGHEVHVLSFTQGQIPGVQIHELRSKASVSGGDLQKLAYLTKAGQVRKLVRSIDPDIINAHYATSYGTVAALAGLKNYVLSVWGADIYDFPKKTPIHRMMLRYSLRRAAYIFSTSKAMAEEAGKYTKKKIEVTPFGVDMELFSPEKNRPEEGFFTVGTVKTLSPKYGIDYLLKAAALVKQEQPQIPLKLRIAGKGPNAQEYRELAKTLGIEDTTTWLGFISQEQAAMEWAGMDVAVVPSTLESESFGVSAVEAESCGCPVVISDIPGLMEATNPGVTSMVVPRKNERALADALITLYWDETRRKEMGAAGRAYVAQNYELTACFRKVEDLFREICK